MQVKINEDARRRLYEMVGYPQGRCRFPLAADIELVLDGLVDPKTGEPTKAGHDLAETLLFCS